MSLSIENPSYLDIATEPVAAGPKLSVATPGYDNIDTAPARPDLSRSTPAERMLFNRAPNPAVADQRAAETERAEPAPRSQPAAEPGADLIEAAERAAAEAAKAMARANEMQRAAPPLPNTPEPPERMPRMHEFDSAAAHDEAVDQWQRRTVARAVDRVVIEQRQKYQQAAVAQAQAEAVTALGNRFAARQALVEAQHPDFQEVTFKNKELTQKISENIGLLLLNNERGPDLLYQLGKNPAEAARLSEAYRMPQLKAGRRAQMFFHTGEGGR